MGPRTAAITLLVSLMFLRSTPAQESTPPLIPARHFGIEPPGDLEIATVPPLHRRDEEPQAASGPCVEADLLFGVPTGFRLQRSFESAPAWRAEGFVGLELIFPAIGAGFRRQFSPYGASPIHLEVNPGLDGYLIWNWLRHSKGPLHGGADGAALIALDLDTILRIQLGNHGSGLLGVKVGGGPAFSRNSGFLPVACLFGGLQF